MNNDRNIKWHHAKITKQDRWEINGHRSAMVWITGLSASGKSSIAAELERRLFLMGMKTFILDGDNVRHGLNKDLGFSHEDRHENLRRVGEVGKLLVEAGIITIAAFISPYLKERSEIRALFDEGEFIEVYLDCALSVCEQRDPKGLYRKARLGEIPSFTGISDPYEPPEHAEIRLRTDQDPIDRCVDIIVDFLEARGIFRPQ